MSYSSPTSPEYKAPSLFLQIAHTILMVLQLVYESAQPNWALQGTLTRRIASVTPYGRP